MSRRPLTRYGGSARLVNAIAVFAVGLGLFLAPAPAAEPVTVLAVGDSLTAGLGLARSDAFPARLEAALKRDGLDVRVVNAGVSGDTTAGGRARLAWSLASEPAVDAVILALGANDGLRGLDPAASRANLAAMLADLKARGIPVLLAGMRAPPNLGPEYGAEFDAIFPALAADYAVALYPFFLDGVAADPALNQDDGIHPNAAGVDVMVGRMLALVKKLIAVR